MQELDDGIGQALPVVHLEAGEVALLRIFPALKFQVPPALLAFSWVSAGTLLTELFPQ